MFSFTLKKTGNPGLFYKSKNASHSDPLITSRFAIDHYCKVL